MAILQRIGRDAFHSSLTVTPEVMLAKASSVQKRIREMQDRIKNLENTVNKTRSYWIGDAGDAHRRWYDSQKEEIRKIFSRLNEDVEDMRRMAAVYAKAEQEAEGIANDLPSDVIV